MLNGWMCVWTYVCGCTCVRGVVFGYVRCGGVVLCCWLLVECCVCCCCCRVMAARCVSVSSLPFFSPSSDHTEQLSGGTAARTVDSPLTSSNGGGDSSTDCVWQPAVTACEIMPASVSPAQCRLDRSERTKSQVQTSSPTLTPTASIAIQPLAVCFHSILTSNLSPLLTFRPASSLLVHQFIDAQHCHTDCCAVMQHRGSSAAVSHPRSSHDCPRRRVRLALTDLKLCVCSTNAASL